MEELKNSNLSQKEESHTKSYVELNEEAILDQFKEAYEG